MDKFIIRGGKKLSGEITLSGSKNGTLPVMAAALLTKGITTLRNTPYLRDIQTMSNVIRVVGARVFGGRNTIKIDTTHCNHMEAPYDLVKTMRASFYVLGPLLARYGRVRVSLPGGCAWGPRPVDIHIKGMQALGADVRTEHGFVEACAKRLTGCRFEFDKVSVGATANIIMAATLARGVTQLINTAKEPEITFLINTLNRMGANVRETRDGVEIKGVKELKPVSVSVIPDRIEAGTFIAAVILAGGRIKLLNAPVKDLASTIEMFEKTGAAIKTGKEMLVVEAPKIIRPVEVTTSPFPGFPTDLQAQIMAVLSMGNGTSIITDTIYHDRFTHVPELKRLGANIALTNNTAVIMGVKKLSGAPVMATDLRASAALVIAGLKASGQTEVSRVYHIDRGYEKIEEKLKGVGARIERSQDQMVY